MNITMKTRCLRVCALILAPLLTALLGAALLSAAFEEASDNAAEGSFGAASPLTDEPEESGERTTGQPGAGEPFCAQPTVAEPSALSDAAAPLRSGEENARGAACSATSANREETPVGQASGVSDAAVQTRQEDETEIFRENEVQPTGEAAFSDVREVETSAPTIESPREEPSSQTASGADRVCTRETPDRTAGGEEAQTSVSGGEQPDAGADHALTSRALRDAEIPLTVYNADSGVVEKTTMEDCLLRALAAEMSASAPMEALKAQAVAIRSYILSKAGVNYASHCGAMTCTDMNHCMSGLTREEYDRLDERDRACYERAQRETDGIVMTYNEKIITANFHSCSYFRTASAKEAFGVDVPYLQSVDTWVYKEVFHVYEFSSAELLARLSPYGGAYNEGAVPYGKCTETADGRVKSVTLNGAEYPAQLFRQVFGFPSTLFEVSYDPDGDLFRFFVYGSGHGVGMSQSGAKAMANDGASYTEILTHYYTGVTVSPLEEAILPFALQDEAC